MSLEQAWAEATGQPVMVVTGAGVSRASGLPTFRGTDPGAIWSQEVTERGTRRFFEAHPAQSWAWYLARFDQIAQVACNPAHHALADLEAHHSERGGPFLLVTQNVDGLHGAAGSREVVQVHGRADQVRCTTPGCVHAAPRGHLSRRDADFEAFRQAPTRENLPACPACGGLLRPHILWFDERYTEHHAYEIARVLGFAKRARLLLFAGTSFSVGVTAAILERGLRRGARIFSIDPAGRSPHPHIAVIAQPAEVALPALRAALGEATPP